MLNAILSGKRRGLNFAGEEDNPELANATEDLLTASVFERVLYLSRIPFARVISRILGLASDNLTFSIRETDIELIEDAYFWPRWPANERGERGWVEPDCFMRFNDFDLLIEAKRYDFLQQYPAQWARELRSYGLKYGAGVKHLVFLAVGGVEVTSFQNHRTFLRQWRSYDSLAPFFDRFDARLTIIGLKWRELFFILEGAVGETQSAISDCRIMRDVRRAMEYHGFWLGKPEYFSDFAPSINPFRLGNLRGAQQAVSVAGWQRPPPLFDDFASQVGAAIDLNLTESLKWIPHRIPSA